MAEVLSQSQIDMLLNSMKNGGSQEEAAEQKEKKNYRLYDFYSPKKFTKDKLRILKGIYDNYCRIATSQINSLFRVNSEVSVVSIEEQRYYEFSNALSDSDVLTLVHVSLPTEGKYPPMLIHISQILMANLIDRMLGGVVYDTTIDSTYTYTDLELPLYEKIMGYMVRIIRDAWSSYVLLDPEVDRVEENPSLLRDISVDETVVIIMLNIKMQDISGKMTICVPGDLMFAVFQLIEKGKHSEDAYDYLQQGTEDEILERLKKSVFQVDARLGKAKLNLNDICDLQVGDVINLNRHKDAEVDIYVEGQPWFFGKLGVHNKNVAVKISRRREELIELGEHGELLSEQVPSEQTSADE